MDAIERLQKHVWKHPRDYGGFSPDGDYVILTRTRDSDTLERSNWECIARDMGAEAWDAPDNVLRDAGEIVSALADYPIYSEDHFSELEYTEACELWERSSVADRVDYLQRARLCIFAARRDEMPQDDCGALLEQLRG